MPDDLYDRDILAWSRAQADRLRRLAAGERVEDVDWEHVIEEIEDVGRGEVAAVRSPLLHALLRALKAAAWPDHGAARTWRNEVVSLLAEARACFQPGMAQAIDLADLYRRARNAGLDLDMRRPPRALPAVTDLTLAELMDDSLGADALIARVGPRDAA